MVSDDALIALALRYALTILTSLTIEQDPVPSGSCPTQESFDLGDIPSLSAVEAQKKINQADSDSRKAPSNFRKTLDEEERLAWRPQDWGLRKKPAKSRAPCK